MKELLTSRVTSKSQTTIPRKVRDTLQIKPGDLLGYEIRDGRVFLRKVEAIDRPYLRALQETLSEWNSSEDAAAFDDL